VNRRRGGIDEAFTGWPEFERRSIGANGIDAVRAQRSPIAGGPPGLTDGHLANFDFVCPSDSKPYGAPIREIYENAGTSGSKRCISWTIFLFMARIVAKTGAIGMVNRAYAKSTSFGRSFATLDHPNFFPPAQLCCAIRQASRHAPRRARADGRLARCGQPPRMT